MKESALNHLKGMGLIAEGFGSTPEMSIRDLIWVVYRMKIVVESYPSWYIYILILFSSKIVC